MSKSEIIEKHWDELQEYLEWEGIIGYTSAIIDILENGKKSIYYETMKEEKGEE